MSNQSTVKPVRFGKYELHERLGRGGMADVWKARLTGPGGFSRSVVVKRILPQFAEDERFVLMFVNEARLSAQLNHPNIVQVFEFGELGGEYFLVMEHVSGFDLGWLMKTIISAAAPEPGFGAIVMREVCRALAYAHALTDEQGTPLRLIHRDVSPSNVMVGFNGAVKLCDFGVAKALSEVSDLTTQSGIVKGKLWYMAPERIDCEHFDHRSDLFSAGAVLYETLTGRRLANGDTPIKVIKQLMTGMEPPSSVRKGIPPALDAICMRALARRPEDRYQSGEEMANDLDRAVNDLGWSGERLVAFMAEVKVTSDKVVVDERTEIKPRRAGAAAATPGPRTPAPDAGESTDTEQQVHLATTPFLRGNKKPELDGQTDRHPLAPDVDAADAAPAGPVMGPEVAPLGAADALGADDATEAQLPMLPPEAESRPHPLPPEEPTQPPRPIAAESYPRGAHDTILDGPAGIRAPGEEVTEEQAPLPPEATRRERPAGHVSYDDETLVRPQNPRRVPARTTPQALAPRRGLPPLALLAIGVGVLLSLVALAWIALR